MIELLLGPWVLRFIFLEFIWCKWSCPVGEFHGQVEAGSEKALEFIAQSFRLENRRQWMQWSDLTQQKNFRMVISTPEKTSFIYRKRCPSDQKGRTIDQKFRKKVNPGIWGDRCEFNCKNRKHSENESHISCIENDDHLWKTQ
jgi:hypothetical protein